VKDKKTQAVIYTRFSPRRNAGESESCEVQEAVCRKHCATKGYIVKSVHHDKALSGGDADRPSLWQAVEAVDRGEILLVSKLDRLARDVYLSECIKRAVASAGGQIEAVSGDVEGYGPEQEMIRQVLASFAEYERKVISARTKCSMRFHQSNGRKMSRFAPYGYKIDPNNESRLLVDEYEQVALTKIHELLLSGKKGSEITRVMNGEMPEYARGKGWSYPLVYRIITRLED